MAYQTGASATTATSYNQLVPVLCLTDKKRAVSVPRSTDQKRPCFWSTDGGVGLGNMVFGLCRGAWPYKGPCTAGGKLAAEALRVLKKSTQHAGARKTRLGRRPLIPLFPCPIRSIELAIDPQQMGGTPPHSLLAGES